MRRGEIYLVENPSKEDPRPRRPFVIISRQAVIDGRFSTVTCAPIYTNYHNFESQVPIGIEEGLKHDSAIHCDELVSFTKKRLTHYLGSLGPEKTRQLNDALRIALELDHDEYVY